MTSDGVEQPQPPVSTEWTVSRQALRKFIGLEPGEGVPAFLAGLMFFCLMGAYFILKPLRDEMGIAGGVRNLPNLYLVTLAVMLVAAPLFGAASRGRRREVFLPRVYRFLGANLLLFFALFSLLPGADAWLGRGFYVWVSVFNLFSLSLFWGFMADGFGFRHGRRVLGVVAVGGTAGAILGASITGLLVQPLGRVPLLLVSLGFLETAVQLVRPLSRRFDRLSADAPPAHAAPTTDRPGIWSGVMLVLSRPTCRPSAPSCCSTASARPSSTWPRPASWRRPRRVGPAGLGCWPASRSGCRPPPCSPSWPSPDASCDAWAPAPSWRPCRW